MGMDVALRDLLDRASEDRQRGDDPGEIAQWLTDALDALGLPEDPAGLADLEAYADKKAVKFSLDLALALLRGRNPETQAETDDPVTVPAPREPEGHGAPAIRRASDLMGTTFRPLEWMVPDVLPEGFYLLVAREKIGKTWLALKLALEVASGDGRFLSQYPVSHGEALYIFLDGSERQLQGRLNVLRGDQPVPEDLYVTTTWRRADDGGLDDLAQWLDQHPTTRLVVFDIFQNIRRPARPRQNAYGEDYLATREWTALAAKYRVCILALHHENKGDKAYSLHRTSGTAGLTAGADGALMLTKDPETGIAGLEVIGREMEHQVLAVRFDTATCTWVLTNDRPHTDYLPAGKISHIAHNILAILGHDPLTPAVIADRTHLNVNSVRDALRQMVGRGLVSQPSYGRYTLPPVPSRTNGTNSSDSPILRESAGAPGLPLHGEPNSSNSPILQASAGAPASPPYRDTNSSNSFPSPRIGRSGEVGPIGSNEESEELDDLSVHRDAVSLDPDKMPEFAYGGPCWRCRATEDFRPVVGDFICGKCGEPQGLGE